MSNTYVPETSLDVDVPVQCLCIENTLRNIVHVAQGFAPFQQLGAVSFTPIRRVDCQLL